MKRLILTILGIVCVASFGREANAWIVVRGPYYRPPMVIAPPYGYYRPPAYYYRPPVYVAPPCGYYPYARCY
jgi:hypothetical protein